MSIDALLRNIDSEVSVILNNSLSNKEIELRDTIKLFNVNGLEMHRY